MIEDQEPVMPPPPPVPVKQKASPYQVLWVMTLVVLAIVVLTLVANGYSDTTSPPATAPGKSRVVTAATIVDLFPAADQAKLCTAYEVLGYQVALDTFMGGYGTDTVDPSGEEIFNEAISRC